MNRPKLARTRLPDTRSGLTLIELVVVVVILLLLVAMMLPATRNARGAARRTQCRHNLRQIGIALHNYADTYGVHPPAYTFDENGNRLHDWRTLILPYMDSKALYTSIDLSKPWDHPVNADAKRIPISAYVCPEAPLALESTYLAVVTPESFLRPNEGAKMSDMKDSPSVTMAVIEVPSAKSLHWMNPSDADESLVIQSLGPAKLNHLEGTTIGLVDGTVRFIGKNISRDTLHALTTASGDDVVGEFGEF